MNMYEALCETMRSVDKDFHKKVDDAYKRGLDDAWKCARKICTNWCLSDKSLNEIFGDGKTIDEIMKEYPASEAIAKIKEYEQEKTEREVIFYDIDGNEYCRDKIRVGDELIPKCESPHSDLSIYIVTHIYRDTVDAICRDGITRTYEIDKLKKTGRHYPQIAEVLEQIEEQIKEKQDENIL